MNNNIFIDIKYEVALTIFMIESVIIPQIRLSVGLEDTQDLIDDLDQALKQAVNWIDLYKIMK